MSWNDDDTPWRQSERQRKADDLLEEWVGEPAAPPTSAYPAEWQQPPLDAAPPKRPGRRRRRQEARERSAAGTADQAVVVREVRRPRQEFPLPPDGPRTTTREPRAGSTPRRATRPTTRRSPARRSRGSWVGGLIGFGVVLVIAIGGAISYSSGGGGGGGSSDIADMGNDLSPYGLPIELTDLGTLPADHVFTFQGDPDLWDSAVDGWRTPGEMLRVYLDPALTVPAPDAWVGRYYEDDTDSTLQVSPSYDTVLTESGSDVQMDLAVGERWGAAAEYYLVQLADLTTGEPLDTLPVQRFTVDDQRPRPVVTSAVDDQGVLHLDWERVDGAVRYDVLDPAAGFRSLGQAPDLSWTSDLDDTDDGYRQNESLSWLSGISEDALQGAPDATGAREVGGLAVSAVLQGGRVAVTPVDSSLLSRVPARQASTAWSQEDLYGTFDAAELPGALPYEMADGSTALLPVTYETNSIAEIYSGIYAVRYTVHGARSTGADPLRVSATSLNDAQRLVGQRNTALDAERDPNGPPTPYTY